MDNPAPSPPHSPALAPGQTLVTNASQVQSAIDATPLGDTAQLYAPPGTRIVLDGTAFNITSKSVSLVSSGEGATVDGGGRSRLFTLLAGASLELTGVNCTNGRATTLSPIATPAPSGPNGGAFYASGASNVTLVGAFVINCTVDGPGGSGPGGSLGGAIFLFGQSITTLANCTFDGCVATASGDGSEAVRAAHRPSRGGGEGWRASGSHSCLGVSLHSSLCAPWRAQNGGALHLSHSSRERR